jgi:hypothetical protein
MKNLRAQQTETKSDAKLPYVSQPCEQHARDYVHHLSELKTDKT